ncbi:MAG: 30S ribosomal protein S12 methylthiotransferase RimO [Lachnospiraceae bacterium]|nr:30S ribosomal protein S12 methylthiotransferase RimO [Lachnospiraceae bacterium]
MAENVLNIYFESLGCDKNLVDTEKMMTLLDERGHKLTEEPADAQCAVINTCCFINDAKTESIEAILGLSEYKNGGSLKYLIVVGCLASRYSDEIIKEIPEVDAVISGSRLATLCDVMERLEKGEEHIVIKGDGDKDEALPLKRGISSPVHYTYLKIAEGCDRRCTYCAIPYVKGGYTSFDFEKIMEEARLLETRGVTELIVIAQETTRYGIEKYGRKRLPELLSALCALPFLKWVRVMYCYPEEIDDDLIAVFKKEKKLCHYIDMPIQHSSDKILKRMGRKMTRARLEEIINKFRAEIPDMSIRTTLLVGFPGETQEDYEDLLDFVRKYRLNNLGVFRYSKEENTPAYGFDGQVKESVKKERYRGVMTLARSISKSEKEKIPGSILDVIVDGYDSRRRMFVGRSYMDAPEIDSCVYFDSTCETIISGTIVKVRIKQSDEYDLFGSMVED